MQEVRFVSFSGGRSSAMMAKHLIDQGAPIDFFFFANTGRETKETYEFISAVDDTWLGGRLICLEFTVFGGKRTYNVVSPKELNRTGKPFKALAEATGRLPSPRFRLCTDELKVSTILRYLYDRYSSKETVLEGYVGLRADEPRRIARINAANEAYEQRQQQGKHPLKWSQLRRTPLAELGIGRQDVLDFFSDSKLDLSFDPSDPGMHLSNCAGCFYGNIEEKVKVAIEDPEAAEWWENLERGVYEAQGSVQSNVPDSRGRWIQKHLGREIEPGFESEAYAIHHQYLWKNIREYAALTRGQKMKHAIPLLDTSVAEAGGCGSAECGLDI